MQLTGTIKKINDIQTFASGFQKQEVILTTDEKYPQDISIDFLSDNIDLVEKLTEGSDATIHINIRGREWTNPQGEVKYFNSITGWKVELEKTAPVPATFGVKKDENEAEQDDPF